MGQTILKKRDIDSAFDDDADQASWFSGAKPILRKWGDFGIESELISLGREARGRINKQNMVDVQSVVVLTIMVGLLFFQLVHEWGDIYRAIEDGDAAKAIRILNVNPDYINKKDQEFGRTPLHLAVEFGEIDMIRALLTEDSLRQKSDVNVSDKQGLTPLHIALHCKDKDALEILAKHGADFTITDNYGRTPLFMAVELEHLELILFLLELDDEPSRTAGIRSEMQGYNGASPLHLAALKGNLDIVKVLVDHGADPAQKNSLGGTPYNIAYENLQDDVAEYLKGHN